MAVTGILSLQTEPKINDIDFNLSKVKEMIENFVAKNPEKPLDLIVLPEFFSTGVSKTYTDYSVDENGGKPLELMASTAKKFKTYVVSGTLVVKEGEKLYNKLFLLDRKGETIAQYRKIHLFKYYGGSEHIKITPGENRPIVVPLDFGAVGLSICFDIQYPLHYKKLARLGAEMVVSPSCWAYLSTAEGQKELNTRNFRSMNVARALENAFYFVTVNQGGKSDGSLVNVGHSMVTGPCGEIINEADENESVIYSKIDLDYVRKLRNEMSIIEEE